MTPQRVWFTTHPGDKSGGCFGIYVFSSPECGIQRIGWLMNSAVYGNEVDPTGGDGEGRGATSV